MIVPGNHDIDKSIVEAEFANYKARIDSNIETEKAFNDFISEQSYQDKRFVNYVLFESDFAKYGLDYSLQGKGWSLTEDLGVYCLNTSLCSFCGVNSIAHCARK